MHRTVCFLRPMAGTPYRRYFIGRADGQGEFTVTAIQLSHPDLELVAEPPRVRMAAPRPATSGRVRKLRGTDAPPPATWRCSKCAQVKPTSEFYRRGEGSRGPGSYCKPCHADISRARLRMKQAA